MDYIDDPYDAIKLLTKMLDRALERYTREFKSEFPGHESDSSWPNRELEHREIEDYRISVILNGVQIILEGVEAPHEDSQFWTTANSIRLQVKRGDDLVTIWESKFLTEGASWRWYKRLGEILEDHTS
uniref:Uncharacterized protein n=1 Tax=Ochrobactrum phage ORM_20 TaxID=2985243 RepID=A0A9N6WSP6_9VIRU|nr:hypothetical protein ORM20_00178 [Ochrobactrum phage ORM_20]